MGVDRDYRIRISTIADNSGANATTGALDKLGDAQGRAGEKAEKHTEHLHRMRRVFLTLDSIVPGLGALMEAAFTPVGAAITVAVLVLEKFREAMRQTSDEFRKMEEEAAQPLDHRMEAIRAHTVDLATGMAKLADGLEQARVGEEGLKDSTDKTIAAMRQQIDQSQTLAEASKNNDLAVLEVLHQQGIQNEQQYADAKLQIELDYQRKKTQIAENAAMTEILVKRRALEDTEVKQPELNAQAEGAERRKEKALEDLAALPSSQEMDQRKKDADDALKKWEEAHSGTSYGHGELVRQFETIGAGKSPQEVERWMQQNGQPGGQYFAGGSDLYNDWDRLKRSADAARTQWEYFPATQARRKVTADQAGREADRAERRADENRGFSIATQRDLDRQRAAFDAAHQANAQVGALDESTARIGALEGTQGGRAALAVAPQVASGARTILEAEKYIRQQSGGGTLLDAAERLAAAMHAMSAAQPHINARLQSQVSTIENQVRVLEQQVHAQGRRYGS